MGVSRRRAIVWAGGATAAAMLPGATTAAAPPAADRAITAASTAQASFQNVTTTPERLDEDHQTVTISGTVVITAADGTSAPAAGQQISISALPAVIGSTPIVGATGVTDDQGHFAIDMTLEAAASVRLYFASYYGGPPPVEYDFTLAAAVRPTRLTVAPASPDALEGSAVHLSGLLEWQVSGVWQPLAGRPVQVIEGTYPTETMTTDTDGRFAFTRTAAISHATTPTPTTYEVAFNYFDSRAGAVNVHDYFAAASSASTGVRIWFPVQISFGAGQHADLRTYSMTFLLTYPGSRSRLSTDVRLQTRLSPTGPWMDWRTISMVNSGLGPTYAGFDEQVDRSCYLRAVIDADDLFPEAISETVFVQVQERHVRRTQTAPGGDVARRITLPPVGSTAPRRS